MGLQKFLYSGICALALGYSQEASADSGLGIRIAVDSTASIEFSMNKEKTRCELRLHDSFEGYDVTLLNYNCNKTVDRISSKSESYKRNKKNKGLFKDSDAKYARVMKDYNIIAQWNEQYNKSVGEKQ